MKKLIEKLAVMAAFFGVLLLFAAVSYRMSFWRIREIKRELTCAHGQVARALFSSQDDLRSLLISLIDAEQKRIRFAIYTMTDRCITQALIRAAQRGISVEGIVDRSYGQSRYSKVCTLANAQIPLWVFQPRDNGLMHNKFCIFDRTIDGQPLLWTGSYNFTASASDRNEENVLILDNKAIISAFATYFGNLKKRSLQISGALSQTDRSLPGRFNIA